MLPSVSMGCMWAACRAVTEPGVGADQDRSADVVGPGYDWDDGGPLFGDGSAQMALEATPTVPPTAPSHCCGGAKGQQRDTPALSLMRSVAGTIESKQ